MATPLECAKCGQEFVVPENAPHDSICPACAGAFSDNPLAARNPGSTAVQPGFPPTFDLPYFSPTEGVSKIKQEPGNIGCEIVLAILGILAFFALLAGACTDVMKRALF